MKIRNKLESTKKINELKLNKFPEQIFKKGEESKVKKFLENYPVAYYAIRDKSKSCGVFKLKVTKENVLEEIKEYSLFSINVSSANYSNNQLLVGEIEFLSNGEIYATLSTDSKASVRDVLCNPTYNLKTDIFDRSLDNIPYFDYIYNYIISKGLMDVIVEFSLFDKEVGINREKIVVYELRTHY